MRIASVFLSLLASLSLAGHALAAPVQLDPVTIGDDLANKVEDYGQRDVDALITELTETLVERLERDGHTLVEDGAAVRIEVTLEDAWPNRPTREQMRDQMGLSYDSVSLGGASLSAVLYNGDGDVVGEIDYRWRTHDIRESVGRGTWADADRSFIRFSRQVVEALEDQSS
jgi:hypothetical protein